MIDMLKLIFTHNTKEIVVEKPIFVFPPYISIALAEYGIHEELNGDNPRILTYLQSVMSQSDVKDEISWCAAFVNWVMRESGYPFNNLPLARSWLSMGKESKEYKQFSVVILKRGSISWQGHVGFVIAERGPYIYVLGGNQSNTVKISEFPKTDVLSYRIF